MLRLPNITGGNTQARVDQIQAYLYQLVQDLEYSLSVTDRDIQAVRKEIPSASADKSPEEIEKTFSEIKALIIKSADIVEAYSEKIIGLIDLSGKYVAQSDFGTYVEDTNYRLDAMDDGITSVASKVSTIDGDIEMIKEEQTQIQQSAESVKITVNKIIEDGATKVVTSHGYSFDNDGMNVSKPGDQMKNKVTNRGMYVSRTTGEEGTPNFDEVQVFGADNQGVDALNVTVHQYLNLGRFSRFEDYGEGRTAIFSVNREV